MRVPAYLLVFLMLVLPATAQNQSAPWARGSISAAEILQKNIAATGGLEAHQRVQSLFLGGDFGFSLYHPDGYYSFSYKAPSDDMLEVNTISEGISWSGRRDQHLIRRTTARGIEMINGAGMELVEQDWRSLLEWEFSREYSKIDLVGRTQVNKRWAFAVRFTPRHGDPCVRYYDEESFLMVRMDQVQRFRMSKSQPEVAYPVESYFRDYADHGGLKLPRLIAISRDVGELQFNVTKFEPNAAIDDSIFK